MDHNLPAFHDAIRMRRQIEGQMKFSQKQKWHSNVQISMIVKYFIISIGKSLKCFKPCSVNSCVIGLNIKIVVKTPEQVLIGIIPPPILPMSDQDSKYMWGSTLVYEHWSWVKRFNFNHSVYYLALGCVKMFQCNVKPPITQAKASFQSNDQGPPNGFTTNGRISNSENNLVDRNNRWRQWKNRCSFQ